MLAGGQPPVWSLAVDQAHGDKHAMVDLPDDRLLAGVVLQGVFTCAMSLCRGLTLRGRIQLPVDGVRAECSLNQTGQISLASTISTCCEGPAPGMYGDCPSGTGGW